VDVIIGALILKEYTGMSDDEILKALMFDIRYQYALHTTSFLEEPLSDRSLGRFRERCITYERQAGIDLLHNTITSLSKEMAVLINADRSLKRMDSMMVASNIRKMGRLEFLYTCVANLAAVVKKREGSLPEGLTHYTESDDRNIVVYHNRSDETTDKISVVLSDAAELVRLCGFDFDDASEYQLLIQPFPHLLTDGHIEYLLYLVDDVKPDL